MPNAASPEHVPTRRTAFAAAYAYLSIFLAAAPLFFFVAAGNEAVAGGTGQLVLSVIDRDSGKPLACRVHLVGPGNKPRRPEHVPYWHDHFALDGSVTLKLPTGQYSFVMERGPEYLVREGHFTINAFADDTKQVDLKRFIDMAAAGWYSGDLFVRRPVREIETLMRADDLHLAEVVTWGDDRGDTQALPADTPRTRSFDGNRDYDAAAGRWRRPGTELLLFHRDSAPFGPPPSSPAAAIDELAQVSAAAASEGAWADLTAPFWQDLPLLVAHGSLSSIEIAHRQLGRETSPENEGDGRPRDRKRFPSAWGVGMWSQEIYFQLLEAGVRLPPTAGSGSGDSPNPVGYNRVYVYIEGPFSPEKWWEAVRAGRVVVTNGPLMQPRVEGQPPGYTFQGEAGRPVELEIGLTFSTRDPVSYLEIIQNGKVAQSVRIAEYAKTGRLPKVRFEQSGWFLLRAVTDLNKTYRFAMTAPYFVEIGYKPRISRSAAKFFLDWTNERAAQLAPAGTPPSAASQGYLDAARRFWQQRLDQATVD